MKAQELMLILILFVNGVKIYHFKAKESELNALYLGNISNDFTVGNMKNKDYMDICMIFQLIMLVLMLMIFYLFMNY